MAYRDQLLEELERLRTRVEEIVYELDRLDREQEDRPRRLRLLRGGAAVVAFAAVCSLSVFVAPSLTVDTAAPRVRLVPPVGRHVEPTMPLPGDPLNPTPEPTGSPEPSRVETSESERPRVRWLASTSSTPEEPTGAREPEPVEEPPTLPTPTPEEPTEPPEEPEEDQTPGGLVGPLIRPLVDLLIPDARTPDDTPAGHPR